MFKDNIQYIFDLDGTLTPYKGEDVKSLYNNPIDFYKNLDNDSKIFLKKIFLEFFFLKYKPIILSRNTEKNVKNFIKDICEDIMKETYGKLNLIKNDIILKEEYVKCYQDIFYNTINWVNSHFRDELQYIDKVEYFEFYIPYSVNNNIIGIAYFEDSSNDIQQVAKYIENKNITYPIYLYDMKNNETLQHLWLKEYSEYIKL